MGRRAEFESSAPASAVEKQLPKLMEGAGVSGGKPIKKRRVRPGQPDPNDPRNLPSWKHDLMNPDRERTPEELESSEKRRKELHETMTDKSEQGLKESAEKAKADAAARKENEAARLEDSTTEARQTPDQREAERRRYSSGKAISSETFAIEAAGVLDTTPSMSRNLDIAARDGDFLSEAHKTEDLIHVTQGTGNKLPSPSNTISVTKQEPSDTAEPAWKQAGFSSAEEHASELEGLYRKEFPGTESSRKQKLLDISRRGRRWPADLDVASIDIPTPTASETTVGLFRETGGSEKAAKEATSSPEEALTIAKRKGKTGSSRQVSIDTTRDQLYAERAAYKASRQEELMKEHKNPDDTWKDTATAHSEETEAKLADYDRKISNIRSTRAKSADKAVTEEEQQATKTGNTEAALKGLVDDFKIAHESGDVMGRERARVAYHNVGVDEGYHAHIDTPCATANCGNIIKGESQISKAEFKPVPGRTLGLSKGETEFRQTGITGGDEEGTVCKDCAAKGL